MLNKLLEKQYKRKGKYRRKRKYTLIKYLSNDLSVENYYLNLNDNIYIKLANKNYFWIKYKLSSYIDNLLYENY